MQIYKDIAIGASCSDSVAVNHIIYPAYDFLYLLRIKLLSVCQNIRCVPEYPYPCSRHKYPDNCIAADLSVVSMSIIYKPCLFHPATYQPAMT